MNEYRKTRSEQYNRLRDDFDTLAVEDKALFLLEATVSTLVRGIESFGKALGDELEHVFRRAEQAAAEAEAEAEAEAAAEAEAGTPAPNVTPEPTKPATDPTAPPDDIPGPRSKRRGSVDNGNGGTGTTP